MDIALRHIPIRELVAGYKDDAEDGVVGYGGRLDIRPKYQREFVYKGKKKTDVIHSVRNGFPLNIMYWARKEDGNFEVLDGQQRTVTICQYVEGDFSVERLFFENLTDAEQKQILDYELMVYFCSGTDREKLDWFEIVNLAGERLTDQELRNAVYSGTWATDAKRYFSKTGGPAQDIASRYVNGDPIRQHYLELALGWITTDLEFAGDKDERIREYMAQHQHDENAEPLWSHFQSVIGWVKSVFPTYRKEMKGLLWGDLYAKFKDASLDSTALETEVERLMADDEVKSKTGIYSYVLTEDEKHLNLRAFTKSQKRTVLERQGKKCKKCGKEIDFADAEADHITPWSEGGKTDLDNCQILCRDCNRRKSNK